MQQELRIFDNLFDRMFDFSFFPQIPQSHDFSPLRFSDLPCDQSFIIKNGQYEYETMISPEMIDDLKIVEKNGMIHLSATQRQKVDQSDRENNIFMYKSRSYSSWNQSLRLPINAVPNSAIASYQDGKLKLIAKIKNNE